MSDERTMRALAALTYRGFGELLRPALDWNVDSIFFGDAGDT